MPSARLPQVLVVIPLDQEDVEIERDRRRRSLGGVPRTPSAPGYGVAVDDEVAGPAPAPGRARAARDVGRAAAKALWLVAVDREFRHVSVAVLALFARSPRQMRHAARWTRSLAARAGNVDLRLPWLPYDAIEHLEQHLDRAARVFEYGSGGSTLWLAERVGEIVAVEHDPSWLASVRRAVESAGIRNCTLLVREPAPGPARLGTDYGSSAHDGSFERYVTTIDDYPDGAFDLVIVDGRSRRACIAHAMPKVRTGGMLLLDDSDRPDYAPALERLAAWECTSFVGIRPASLYESRTTIWTRPRDDLATRPLPAPPESRVEGTPDAELDGHPAESHRA